VRKAKQSQGVLDFFEVMLIWIKRDIKLKAAYKTNFMIMCLDIVVAVLIWGFLGSSIQYQLGLQTYGNISPLAFILSGMMLDLILRLPGWGSQVLLPERFYGTLIRPTPIWKQAVWFNAFNILWSALSVTVYLIIGFFFGMTTKINILSLVIVISLGLAYSLGFGMMTAGINLIIKSGDPINWLTNILTRLVSGQMFPISVLPMYVQSFSWILPQTWTYLLWRLAIFTNASLLNISEGILVLTVMSTILLCLGYWLLQLGIKKCKTEGVIT
jgi:ABC-2 type transport system permease protein